MSRANWMLAGAALALATAAFGGEGNKGDAKLEQQVREATTRYQEAWNKQDLRAMANEYTSDATVMTFEGDEFRGRDQITRYIRDDFSKELRGTRVSFEIENIEQVSPTLALVDLRQTITGGTLQEGTGGAGPMVLHSTVLGEKQGDQWKIKALRIFPAQAPGATQEGVGGTGEEGTEGPPAPPPMTPERGSPSDEAPGTPPENGQGEDTYLP